MQKNTFKFLLLFFLVFHISAISFAQDRVLIYTETSGFRHESIDAGVQMITQLGNENGLWETDRATSATSFTTANLANYVAVIWCNTSGDDLLNADQQAAFEDYIANGGGFVGIHAATDTYRDGSWPFYNELVGGIVQTDPNHTDSNYEATMTVLNEHPSVDFIEDTYTKVEEYYYWELNGGYLYPENINLLEVEATGEETYDAARPISWYKEYMGGRSFYTALGHNTSDYTEDETFIRHVEEGIKYAIGNTLSFDDATSAPALSIYPNPARDHIRLETSSSIETVKVYDIHGRRISEHQLSNENLSNYEINSSSWSPGIYFITATGPAIQETIKILKR